MNNQLSQKEESPQKKCYTISEVSEQYNVSESTLRYWEQKTILKPRRSPKGTRYYHHKDLKIIDRLNYLIIEKGLTVDAASSILKSSGDQRSDRELAMRDRLLEAKKQLNKLKESIDHILDDVF